MIGLLLIMAAVVDAAIFIELRWPMYPPGHPKRATHDYRFRNK